MVNLYANSDQAKERLVSHFIRLYLYQYLTSVCEYLI